MSSTNHFNVLRKIRASLFHAAALAFKHNINLVKEVRKIVGESDDQEAKLEEFADLKDTAIMERSSILTERELMVYRTICQETEPISINEMLDKFKVNKDTRCSKATLTTVIKVLKRLDLISYTVFPNDKSGYIKKQHGITEPEKICR